MIKIAISSDNHLDVNRVLSTKALHLQANWLLENQVDYYLYGGDLYNDLAKTKSYFVALQRLVGPKVQIKYILGNHDMLTNAPYEVVEHGADRLYLHNRYFDLPGTNWRVIGNNGWYDYSFSTLANEPAKIAQWKQVYWLDSVIDQPMSDQARMQRVLKQVENQLKQATLANKQVIFLTHFAPSEKLLAPQPTFLTKPKQLETYQMINAMMGSNHLGALLTRYPNVKAVYYGHLHGCHAPVVDHQLTYYNQAVGVNKARRSEWIADNFADQWQQSLRLIDLK